MMDRYEEAWGYHHLMVTAAHRYCLGRRTYIVGNCVTWLLHNWKNIEENTRARIRQETQEAIDKECAGDQCDIDEWNKLLSLTEPKAS